jgi:hypothetical protein
LGANIVLLDRLTYSHWIRRRHMCFSSINGVRRGKNVADGIIRKEWNMSNETSNWLVGSAAVSMVRMHDHFFLHFIGRKNCWATI